MARDFRETRGMLQAERLSIIDLTFVNKLNFLAVPRGREMVEKIDGTKVVEVGTAGSMQTVTVSS